MIPPVLALNPGSSSLKAALRDPELRWSTTVERIGDIGGLEAAIGSVASALSAQGLVPDVVSHRVVHGGPRHYRPSIIDDALVADLTAAIALAPLHLPAAIDSIQHARAAWPTAVHVACFDTGFHHELPEASIRLPVAPELAAAGVRRYGFHGLSVMSVLHARPDLGQVVIAHLGSGCSVTAVADGLPRHTTMSLTPTGGMVSATRTGDLDPEIVLYLIGEHGYSVDRLRQLLDRQSGLSALAGGRPDMRDLLTARAAGDPAADLALTVFATSAAMAIASCATALDRWESLVFTGGIGEHAAEIRDDICRRLVGLRGALPSPGDAAPVEQLAATGIRVEVVPADEELILDQLARTLLGD